MTAAFPEFYKITAWRWRRIDGARHRPYRRSAATTPAWPSAPSGTCRSVTCESSARWPRGRGLRNPRPREQTKRWIHLPLPCVGTSFRTSAASGLSHPPPGPPVPPGRRVSRLWQDDCTYIHVCIPGLGICFSPRRHGATSAAHYTATRLHAYGATRRRPAERREGRPWAPSGHAPIFEGGAVGASRKPPAIAGLFEIGRHDRKSPV